MLAGRLSVYIKESLCTVLYIVNGCIKCPGDFNAWDIEYFPPFIFTNLKFLHKNVHITLTVNSINLHLSDFTAAISPKPFCSFTGGVVRGLKHIRALYQNLTCNMDKLRKRRNKHIHTSCLVNPGNTIRDTVNASLLQCWVSPTKDIQVPVSMM